MTTRAHFAGLNTAAFAEVLEGFPVLISYADIVRRPGVWEREILPRLEAGAYVAPILDSGAFTELTTPGFHVSVEEYAAFIETHGHLFDQIVTLDDIRGDLARTWNNTARLVETGAEIIPVFHGREPFEVLHHYCQRFGRVGLGFARDFGRIAKDQGNGLGPDAWLTQALDIIESYGVEVHGFGMTRYALTRGHDRLTTTDSTTWIAEYRAVKNTKGGTHSVAGQAAQVVAGMTANELAFFVLLSYRAEMGATVPAGVDGAKGQARTAFRRFSDHELTLAAMTTRCRFERRYAA